MATIAIPWNGRGTETFDRDQLATAVLLKMDHDLKQVVKILCVEHGIAKTDAMYLAVAARICLERGIEP